MRFGQKDADLQRLAARNDFRAIIVHALKKHLRKARSVLPLPPQTSSRVLPQYYTFRFAQTEDSAIYGLLKAIPAGSRSVAIKRLIRHSMAQCDLRDLSPDPELVMPRKPQARKRNPAKTKAHPPNVAPKSATLPVNSATPTSSPMPAPKPPEPVPQPKPIPPQLSKPKPDPAPRPTSTFSADDEDVFDGI